MKAANLEGNGRAAVIRTDDGRDRRHRTRCAVVGFCSMPFHLAHPTRLDFDGLVMPWVNERLRGRKKDYRSNDGSVKCVPAPDGGGCWLQGLTCEARKNLSSWTSRCQVPRWATCMGIRALQQDYVAAVMPCLRLYLWGLFWLYSYPAQRTQNNPGAAGGAIGKCTWVAAAVG